VWVIWGIVVWAAGVVLGIILAVIAAVAVAALAMHATH
jgi:hypothetical protein